jgi:hypothetical protein
MGTNCPELTQRSHIASETQTEKQSELIFGPYGAILRKLTS